MRERNLPPYICRCRHVPSTKSSEGMELSIDEVAAHAGTIGYELMCAVAQRVRVQSDVDIG